MANSSAANPCRSSTAKNLRMRGEVVRRLACEPVRRRPKPRNRQARCVHRDCADALRPPHRAACWRAPRAKPCRTREDQRDDPLGMARPQCRSAIAAPIEMPPTTNRSTPRWVAKASTSSAKVAIEIVCGVAGRRPALPPAFQRQAAIAVAIGKDLRHLCLVAAEPVLEDDRQAGAARRGLARRLPPRWSANQLMAPLPTRRPGAVRRQPPVPPLRSAHASPAARRSPHCASACTKCAEIDDAAACGGKAAVGAPVLGVRHHDAVGEHVDRLGDDAARSRRQTPSRTDWPGRARS